MVSKTLHLLEFSNLSIFEQLKIEEALLRLDERDICVINYGSMPSIVMGISGKPHDLIDFSKVENDPIPIIKRFSGGGTVVIDENTLFVTFIFQKESHNFPLFPEPIYRFTENLYKTVFKHPDFALKENDYVLGEQKCGGNAQYIRKNRFLHHSTFLWDYEEKYMQYLLMPKKKPTYRRDRSHVDFLCRMKDHFPSLESLKMELICELKKRYNVQFLDQKEISSLLTQPHRKSTSLIK